MSFWLKTFIIITYLKRHNAIKKISSLYDTLHHMTQSVSTHHLSHFECLVVPDHTLKLTPGALSLLGEVTPHHLTPEPCEMDLFVMLLMTVLQPVQKLLLNGSSLLLLYNINTQDTYETVVDFTFLHLFSIDLIFFYLITSLKENYIIFRDCINSCPASKSLISGKLNYELTYSDKWKFE